MVLHAYFFQMPLPSFLSLTFIDAGEIVLHAYHLKLSFLSFCSQSVEFKAYLATSIAPELQVHASGISSEVAAP